MLELPHPLALPNRVGYAARDLDVDYVSKIAALCA